MRQLSHVLSAGPHTVQTMRERETRTIQERRERSEGREGRERELLRGRRGQ